MPTPELALAGFDTGLASIKLLRYIVQTAQKVKRLKTECEDIGKTAQIMLDVLNDNFEALKDKQTAQRLNEVLERLAKVVTECQRGNVLAKAWEVMWRRRLPGLMKDMMTWIALLTMETTVSSHGMPRHFASRR